MKNLIVASLSVAFVCAAFADEAAKPDAAKRAPQKSYEERTGGFVVQKGSAKGTIHIVNAQKAVDRKELVEATEAIRKDVRYDFTIVDREVKPVAGKCPYMQIKKELNAQVLVVVVDVADAPTLLGAPEDGWAVVNVSRLAEGLVTENAKKKFVADRARKEILRAFCYAAGGIGTQFPGNVLAVSSLKELDYCGEFLPMDAVQRVMETLFKKGLVPERAGTYRKACMEGWAPAPTNSFQKAFWDRYMAD